MSRAQSVTTLRKRLAPYFKRLGIKRMPELIFDNRRHHFSPWGLSQHGQWWYRLSPEHNRGAIGEGWRVLVSFPLGLHHGTQEREARHG